MMIVLKSSLHVVAQLVIFLYKKVQIDLANSEPTHMIISKDIKVRLYYIRTRRAKVTLGPDRLSL